MSRKSQTTYARTRLYVAFLVGLVVALFMIVSKHSRLAPLAAWDSMALVYGIWVCLAVLPMSAAEAKSHALRENPGRALTDGILLSASIASLGAVVVLIMHASNAHGISKLADISLGLFSIIVSWAVVHTTYALNYTRQYYGEPEGGVEFNENTPPKYADFFYLAFTVGMTFQVSDTEIKTKQIRTTILKHALLSYLFGTVIIATTINTLASLTK